jgi:hypothetical protein
VSERRARIEVVQAIKDGPDYLPVRAFLTSYKAIQLRIVPHEGTDLLSEVVETEVSVRKLSRVWIDRDWRVVWWDDRHYSPPKVGFNLPLLTLFPILGSFCFLVHNFWSLLSILFWRLSFRLRDARSALRKLFHLPPVRKLFEGKYFVISQFQIPIGDISSIIKIRIIS